MRHLLFVVNADWFFVSHRLHLARAARDAGFVVTVCAGKSEAHETIVRAGFAFEPLSIVRAGMHPVEEGRTLWSLVDLYRRLRPTVVHHVTSKPVLYGSVAAAWTGVPAVVNAVSGLGYAFTDRGESTRRQRALRMALRAGYRLALGGPRTRTIFQNADDLEAFVRAGIVDKASCHLVRGSGVDLTKFAPQPLPDGPPTVLLPARLLADKGIREFVQAARRLRGRYPSARFVLVGRLDPENPAALPEAEVRQWQRDGVVEWWGPRSHDEMPDIFARCHVVALPSYREGLPLALAEAAACGRAVVTTDVPGCRDAIVDGATGWLCEPRDVDGLTAALDAALSDPDECRRRGEAGVDLARARFGAAAIAEQTLRIYEELLGPASPTSNLPKARGNVGGPVAEASHPALGFTPPIARGSTNEPPRYCHCGPRCARRLGGPHARRSAVRERRGRRRPTRGAPRARSRDPSPRWPRHRRRLPRRLRAARRRGSVRRRLAPNARDAARVSGGVSGGHRRRCVG
jgi:glycosyltransferase involved in cell wall biosynthesis